MRPSPLLAVLVALGVGGRLFFAFILSPLSTQTYPAYALYDRIASEPGDFTLLEVPFGVRSGLERIGHGGEVLQYYQYIHGKRLLGGSVARLPSAVFQFYRAHPVLLFLTGEPPPVADSELTRDLINVVGWSKVRYILVHRALLNKDQATLIESFLDRQPQTARVSVERDVVIYRLAP